MKLSKLGLLVFLLPVSCLAQTYPYFCPGGALSANNNCSQNVNLSAGAPIQGTLPYGNFPTQANGSILGNNSGSTSTPTALNPLAVANVLQAVIAARAVSTSNITLSGGQTVDGVVLSTGQVMLATAQSTSANNGLWLVNSAGAWTRPTNYPTGYVIPAFCNLAVIIDRGTAFQGSVWDLNTLFTAAVTIGTSNQSWIERVITATVSTIGGVLITDVNGNTVTSLATIPVNQSDCVDFSTLNGSVGDDGNTASTTGRCVVADTGGHPVLNGSGVGPSVTGSGCSLSVGGQDNTGAIVATGADTCTLAFGASFTNAPHCSVANVGTSVAATLSALPTTAHAIFVTAAAGTFSYTCF
jgi:hypothetical protein